MRLYDCEFCTIRCLLFTYFVPDNQKLAFSPRAVHWGICAVDCDVATISWPYSYMVTVPALLGDTMSVTCHAGYAWTSNPSVNASRNATCSHVGGSGAWVMSGNPQCERMLLAYSLKRTYSYYVIK